jgi:hypothetical protein
MMLYLSFLPLEGTDEAEGAALLWGAVTAGAAAVTAAAGCAVGCTAARITRQQCTLGGASAGAELVRLRQAQAVR